MTSVFDDLYLPAADEPAGVLTWGKSPEMTERDLADRVARIGKHRSPNYRQSYLLAANTLLRRAIADRTLDHHALPIFYLQRHAAELIIKEPLHLGLEIQAYREKLGKPVFGFPSSNAQRVRAENSHNLRLLLSDLSEMAAAMFVGVVPSILATTVAEISKLEKNKATWSRYSFSSEQTPNGKQVVQHMADEHLLPLGKIQELLQDSANAVGALWPANGLLMGGLSRQWQDLAREAGELG